jgi:prepilin-type N-terminal cleavage/methylation domain-containing protein
MKRLRIQRRLQPTGFTLVELMVAMLIAALVLFGVYTIYEKSSSAYRVQNQITDVLHNLRFGAEHVKRDLARTGFQATSNSLVDPAVCFNEAALPLLGLIVRRDAEIDPINNVVHSSTENPHVLPTSVTMFGDFWSRGAFLTGRVSGTRVELNRSYYYGATDDGVADSLEFPSDDLLGYWFRNYRLIRLVTQSGQEMYYRIQGFAPTGGGPAGNWPVITLSQAVPIAFDGAGCGVEGEGTGLLVNPVGYVRYRIARDQRASAPVGKHDLVREELDPDSLDPVPRTTLVISEFAVDLQFYDFVFDDGTQAVPSVSGISSATVWPAVTDVVGLGGEGQLGWSVGFTPHRLRALTMKLSVRTANEDVNNMHRPRANRFGPLETFDIDGAAPGAARVRTVASRVMLNNFLARNILP